MQRTSKRRTSPFLRLLSPLLLSLGAAPFGMASTWAQDFGPILGPLAREVSLGPSGAWTGSARDGALVMETQEAGVVRFYEVPWQGTGPRAARSGCG